MTGDRALLVWGGGLLAVVTILVAGAGWIAPVAPGEQLDTVAGQDLPPLTSRIQVLLSDGGSMLVERARPTAEGLEVERGERRWLVPAGELRASPTESVRERFFLLGTDAFGRDVWSRVLHGGRVSLWIGGSAALLALLLGVGVGGLAASAGGAVDALLMRLTDALLAFPRLFLVIALAVVLDASVAMIVLIFAITGWGATARLTRAEILSLKQREFVLAADAVGQSPLGILVRHLLPNALTPVLVYTALRIGDLILLETSLSFLGIGVQPPQPTWGNMIAEGRHGLTSAWWVATFPGIAITLTVLGFHLLGDGLRAWLDPRTR
jgi:peptide/nickel transport system permease protein